GEVVVAMRDGLPLR
ncbi:hypothetical protein AAGT13_15455, partial [Azotobacter salinestris]